MRPGADARPPRTRSRLVLAWLVYVGVTVAAPAANGAWRDADFAGHALLTTGVSGVLLLGWLGLARRIRRFGTGITSNPRSASVKSHGGKPLQIN